MSFASSVARDLLITGRLSDLSFQINLLNEQLLQLIQVSSRLATISANLLPGSPAATLVQTRIAAISTISKGIEIQLRRLQAQERALQTEQQSVQKAIAKNIDSTFKSFA